MSTLSSQRISAYRQVAHLALGGLAGLCLAAGPAVAGCINPGGNERDLIYNNDFHVLQFCNGSQWIGVGPVAGGSFSPSTGAGYFVLTATSYNGNLGGLSGADAKCLTELGTTHTGWKGYAAASGNGLLTSLKVHAFLCASSGSGYPTGSSCNELQPSTIYYFANAGDASKGGGSFTTNSSRVGPGDNADWSDVNHFGVAVTRWDDRYWGDDDTVWGTHVWSSGYDCNAWASASGSKSGDTPTTGATDSGRTIQGTGGDTCNHTQRLICYVNP